MSKVAESKSSVHLAYAINNDGDLKLLADLGTLFLDFDKGAVKSDLLKRHLHICIFQGPHLEGFPNLGGQRKMVNLKQFIITLT